MVKKAVFVVCKDIDGLVLATTRDNGKIGLPGGKQDNGETIFQTALREAKEEGWQINTDINSGKIIHQDIVDDFEVFWVSFSATSYILLDNYKEKSRGIVPILVDVETIRNSGFGNHFIT